MKRIILLFISTAFAFLARGQNVDLRGDSIRIFKNGGNAELVIRNKTRDSTGGILMNTGNGVTQYKRSRAISPTQFTVGGDTITFGGAAAGLQAVLNTSDVVDSFHMRRSSDSSQWIAIFNNGGSTDFISDTIFSFFPSGTFGIQSVLDIRPLISTFTSSLFVSPTGGVPVAMLHARDPDIFDTGIYGETSGSTFGTKWGVVGSSTGGTNNYGVEGIGIGGIGNNAAFRASLPGTWAVNNWSYLGISAASSYFNGPIVTGKFNLQAMFYQFEDWGSIGLYPDSIPTVDPYNFGTMLLGLDTTFGPAITQVFKVKLTNGILGPVQSTLGTNVTSVTFTGHDDAFDMVVVTSGNVTGLICTFVFGQTWDTFPYMSSPGFGSDAATMAATTKCGIWATSTAGGRAEGTITGAGTYHYNIIVHR